MQIIKFLIDFILHLDIHLGQIISTYGLATYGILFLIIFVETGVVFFPFLPGDSLLFASGAFAALGSLNVLGLLFLLAIAAILGDTANYWIGRFFGEKLVANPRVPIKEEHIKKTEKFFEKYGGKAIILARFVPIVRTFAPFVAGAGQMKYSQFIFFNVLGGISWVLIATLAGYFFGNIQFVKDNFSLVVLLIVLISVVPIAIEFIKHRLNRAKK